MTDLPQLDGYRPWHLRECPARRAVNVDRAGCTCPPGQFSDGHPVWEPGDAPRERQQTTEGGQADGT